jgi:hypothetical protein
MEPKFPIFKPRYPLRTRLMILLLPALFFGMLCNTAFFVANFPTIFWLLALAIGSLTSLIPFFIIREVRFPNEMVVRRHFLPDRFFTYKEFEQINSDSIQAGGQRIRMGQITNLDELKDMSQRWRAAKILKESQRPTPEKESLYLQRGYGMYASFWGLTFGIIVMLMDLPWLQFDPRWSLGGTFLLVYLVYIHIVPKYL